MKHPSKRVLVKIEHVWNRLYNLERDSVTFVPTSDPRHVPFTKEDPRYETAVAKYVQEDLQWKTALDLWKEQHEVPARILVALASHKQ